MKLLIANVLVAVVGVVAAVPVASPDGKVVCDFDTPAGVPTVSVRYGDAEVGKMSVAVRSGNFALASAKPEKTVSSSFKPVWGTAATYPENYNELEVSLKDKEGRVRDTVTVRAYNEGVAVQASYMTGLYGSSYRDREASVFTMPEGTVAWGIPGTESTFGREPKPIAELDRNSAWRMPLTMKVPSGAYASLIEANVRDYPRSNLKAEGWTLKPVFAMGGHERRGLVKTPWRALILSPNAGGLITRAYLTELLNDPCAIADTSWIRPGLCVSDQLNCELRQTELLEVARAAKSIGARYLQIDWGWYGTEVPWSEDDCAAYRKGKFKDLAAANPGWEENAKADPRTIAKGHVPYHPTWPYGGRVGVDFDVPALVKELKAMDMGLCLYVHGYVLENCDMDELFALYESWGVAGLKPGFVSYGSQQATECLRQLAEVSARHHLWLDIHDAHIPDGFERTWPHVMITEGGGGQEGHHPVHQDVALPFTRCLVGPFDYTPAFFDEKRTHAHAAAMLLAYPGPTAIMRGKVAGVVGDPVVPFVKALPWTYDETRVLAGEVSDHLVIARRKGTTWYLAALCGETPRDITVDLSFLGEDAFAADIADDMGTRPTEMLTGSSRLTLSMKVGGGAYGVLKRCLAGTDDTAGIQRRLDDCFRAGGGTVTLTAGVYRVGGLRVRSNTTLELKRGAVLLGTRDIAAYNIMEQDRLETLDDEDVPRNAEWIPPRQRKGKRNPAFVHAGSAWHNAIIRIYKAENVKIIAEPGAVIDGQNSFNPKGEEFYRGVHGISAHKSRNLEFRGYRIQHTGNWAHNIKQCQNLIFADLEILAGHDGVHLSSCDKILIQDCTMKTGDDCVAGFDNQDVHVTGCTLNTACSAFRFGGTRFLAEKCRCFGPAEYLFRGSLSKDEKEKGLMVSKTGRRNMLALFTYYADKSLDIREQPSEMTFRDIVVENADRFIHYNFSGNETWQLGMPLGSVRFERVKATGVKLPLCAYGEQARPIELSFKDVSISFAQPVPEFIRGAWINRISVENLTVEGTKGPFFRNWSTATPVLDLKGTCPVDRTIETAREPFRVKAI